ncbi:MAG: PBP1A family penicillin-binding protein [Caulobacteraceae bacterium]|nr:PBP1A family penicillin-binding protein [Caulobacter sp.]
MLATLGALLLCLGLLALFAWRVLVADLPAVPPPDVLWSLNRPPGMTFVDRAGAVIAVRGSRHGAPVSLKALPPYVPRAFLAVEDRRFYRHGGVDPPGVMRALWTDLRLRRTAQGGSTIAQQLARTLFLGPEQTLKRKGQEALLAEALEKKLGKDGVLELYLNRIYFGAGAYGVEAAARTYFGEAPERLTLAQAALLAALPKAPSRLDPTGDLEAARTRARLVLAAMRGEGWITPLQEAEAAAHPAALSPPSQAEGDFGWVLDLAAAEARQREGARAPDLVVTLTVDPRLQPAAAEAVRAAVREARPRGASQAALVALRPDGSIAALVGGLDHRDSQFDRATQALRQPGSAFKPIVYAAALEAGLRPDDVRTDGPVRYGAYAPRNFGGGYAGPVTLAEALARSINTVAVQLAYEVGVRRVAATARRFGLTSVPSDARLPLALGAYEVRLLDLVAALQAIGEGGVRHPPYLVDAIATARGDVLWRHGDDEGVRVMDEERARELTGMMQGVIDHGTGRRAQIGRPAAGKTGTTQNGRDAWFVGFTPDYAAGVWLGDDHGRAMPDMEGGETPAQTWARFMRTAEDGLPVRGFGAAAPDEGAPPAPTADARRAFYDDLADALDAQARE